MVRVCLSFDLSIYVSKLLFVIGDALLCEFAYVFLAFCLLVSIVSGLGVLLHVKRVLGLSLRLVLIDFGCLLLLYGLVLRVLTRLFG